MKIDKGNRVVAGEVMEALPNTMFRVKSDNDILILATLKGVVRRRRSVRIFPGDRVRVEMTPYDETRGRIIEKI